MMKNTFYILFSSIAVLLISACEEPFTPSIADEEPRYVVESYVETGPENRIAPPYAIITTSLPFYDEINRELIENQYVRDADVYMIEDGDSVKLEEYCLSDLPEPLRNQIIRELGISTFDSIDVEVCAYVDLNNQLDVEEGDEIGLDIRIGQDRITSSTTLPQAVPIDKLEFEDPPNPDVTDYKELIGFISDPADTRNYYRYKVSVNGGRYTSGSFSVVDDGIFNGQTFDFPLSNTQQFGDDIDPDVFGLYKEGDTISIKWMSIDKPHFDFWNSLEFASNNQGPFSSYTRVSSNVDGALGIFGGYSVRFYDRFVPED